jgi:hypothetical protein
MHNLYALERNSWKTKNRDNRKIKIQRIESEYLAPDTAEEIILALSLLEDWLYENGIEPESIAEMSEKILQGEAIRKISCNHFENSMRRQVIIKPFEAIIAYRQMLHYYAVKTVAEYFDSHPELDYTGLCELLGDGERVKSWVNSGGQIVPAFRVDKLRKEICEGKYKNWDEIHHEYDLWNEEYPLDKCRHAWAVLTHFGELDFVRNKLLGKAIDFAQDKSLGKNTSNKIPNTEDFKKELTIVLDIHNWIEEQIFESRAKDYRNQFKKATFRNKAEMEQVLGKPEDNSFIRLVKNEGINFKKMINRVITRL